VVERYARFWDAACPVLDPEREFANVRNRAAKCRNADSSQAALL
jgi:hypothetical protein